MRPAEKRLFASSAIPRAAASPRCWLSWPRRPAWGSRSKKPRSRSRRLRFVCDLLGYDPLTLANEGKMVLIVAPQAADAVVAAARQTEYGRGAWRIGLSFGMST